MRQVLCVGLNWCFVGLLFYFGFVALRLEVHLLILVERLLCVWLLVYLVVLLLRCCGFVGLIVLGLIWLFKGCCYAG